MMQTVKIRQQGGALIVTIPRDYGKELGWDIGTEIAVERSGEGISLQPTKRKPRGKFSVAELLTQIDSEEIAALNEDVKVFTDAVPTGKEYW
ncbi:MULTISPECIES: AbrB/MazE/SpoVT family DNA-binding domain-containing protein [Pectobacterium]|nr:MULTISPECIES: AbrB/MazE/SpoVT family DNA-binding domain-containing protein [Pectobacterium]EJS93528.1 ChpS [Pectobacterium wasabiae CFBP 3304]MDG0797931.1 antitoxin [Pectobacterium punjabense]